MEPLRVAKSALQTIWTHKTLWVFGFFVAAAGAGGGARGTGRVKPHVALEDTHGIPGWVLGLAAVGLGLAVVGLLIHVVCDAALIDGVRRSRAAEPVTFGVGVRAGLSSFGRLFRVKALAIAAALGVGGLVLGIPAGLRWLDVLPKAATIGVIVVLLVLAVPVLLSVVFMSNYAARICALEGKGAVQSFREARDFLSGRVRDSLVLLLLNFAGQVAGAAVGLVVVLPAAAIGGAVYFLAGLIPAVIVGAVLAAPFVTAVVGATGAFVSALWTVAYLDGRAQEAA
jgi:hypothetical protein